MHSADALYISIHFDMKEFIYYYQPSHQYEARRL